MDHEYFGDDPRKAPSLLSFIYDIFRTHLKLIVGRCPIKNQTMQYPCSFQLASQLRIAQNSLRHGNVGRVFFSPEKNFSTVSHDASLLFCVAIFFIQLFGFTLSVQDSQFIRWFNSEFFSSALKLFE